MALKGMDIDKKKYFIAWGGNQWNQNQYGGSNSSADNSNDQSQGWMAYYQVR